MPTYIDDKQIGGLPAWNRIGYHLRKAGCMDGLADRIVQRVCDWLKITPSDVKGAVRTAINNDARQLIAILLDDHGLTVGEIAKIINRSRATTIHHIETGHSRAAYGRGFAATLAELRGR